LKEKLSVFLFSSQLVQQGQIVIGRKLLIQ